MCQKSAGVANLVSLTFWQEQLRLVNENGVFNIARNGNVRGLPQLSNNNAPGCSIVYLEKHIGPHFQNWLAQEDHLHPWTWSIRKSVVLPKVPPVGKERCFVTFVKDQCRSVSVYPIRLKSEANECYLQYKKLAERQTGGLVRADSSDGGVKYIINALRGHYSARGIEHQLATAYSQHQTGVAEQMSRALLDFFRVILCHRKIRNSMLAEALCTASCIKNRGTNRILP